ncbi:DDT domain-containing protein DDB_G0282237 [Linum perenne]
MPLLKKTPFPLAESPQDLEPEDLVYQVRFTKEIFRDYQEYVNRINLYRQRMWSCKISGKANLTYEEALVSEKHATEKVQGIPEVLVEPALRVIQFSTLSLKDLADTIGVKLLEFKFVGDELHAKKGEHVVPCRILKVLGDSNGKMHYEVKWLERNKKATETSVVSEDELIRKKKPCSRDILKSFIRESTYRRDPWVLHEHLTRKHGISNDLPEELNDKVFFHNGVVCDKKRKNAGEGDEEGKCKKRKGGDEATSVENNSIREHKQDELIKYPIDDLLVQPAADDQVFTERPLPSRNFDVPMDSVGDLLMVWDYCSSFGRLLHLWPFSLEDFENAICRKDGNVILIVETHSALLHLLLKENGDYFLAAKKKNRKLKITLVNWTEYLCDFIEMVGIPGLSASTSTIKRGHYGLLDVQVKIGILRELVNEAVKTVLFRKKIDQYVEQRQVLGAIFRGEALEEARRKREEKEQSRVEDVSNGVSCNQDVSVNKNNDTNGEVLRKHKGGIIFSEEYNTASDKSDNSHSEIASKKMGKRQNKEIITGTGEVVANQVKDGKKGTTEKKSKEQRKDQFDREMEKRVIRTEPLGKDRHYNRYWWFQRDGRMFVESSDCKEWGYYSSKEELNALMGSLNPKGERERALQKELEKLYSRICGELQKRSKELVDEIGMEETVVRRSTRVRAMPRENPANSYLRYVNKWKED